MTIENNETGIRLSNADEKAIGELIKKLSDSWANGDGQSYGAVFAEDAHYIEAPGNWVVGRKTIAERHQKIFDTIFRNTRIDGNYTSILCPLTSDVVLVHGKGTVLFSGESEQNAKPNGIMTICIVKRNGQWQIVSFQNTPTGKWRSFNFFGRYFKSRFRR